MILQEIKRTYLHGMVIKGYSHEVTVKLKSQGLKTREWTVQGAGTKPRSLQRESTSDAGN